MSLHCTFMHSCLGPSCTAVICLARPSNLPTRCNRFKFFSAINYDMGFVGYSYFVAVLLRTFIKLFKLLLNYCTITF